MLEPDGEVEHEQRDQDFQPIGPVDLVEQAKLMLLGEERRGDRGKRHGEERHEPQHQRIDAGNAEIGEPAARFETLSLPLRPQQLDRRHDHEHAGKYREA